MGVMDDGLDQCEVKLSAETNSIQLSFSVERLLKCNSRASLHEVDEQNNPLILDYSCSNYKNCNEKLRNSTQTVLRPTPVKVLTNLNTQTAITSTSPLAVPFCRFQPITSSPSICPFSDAGTCLSSNFKTDLNGLEVYSHSQRLPTTLSLIEDSYNFPIPALLDTNCTLRLPPTANGTWSLTAGNSSDSNTDTLLHPGANSVNKTCSISLENSLRSDIYKQNANHANSLVSVHPSHNNKRKRSWSRAVFSNLQRKGLEIQFQQQKYITKPDRRKLAARLNLTDAQVKVWFQNRRMKWRHTRDNQQKTDPTALTKMDGTLPMMNSNNSHSTISSSKEIGQMLLVKVDSGQNPAAMSTYFSDTSNSSSLDNSETEGEDLEIDVVEL